MFDGFSPGRECGRNAGFGRSEFKSARRYRDFDADNLVPEVPYSVYEQNEDDRTFLIRRCNYGDSVSGTLSLSFAERLFQHLRQMQLFRPDCVNDTN